VQTDIIDEATITLCGKGLVEPSSQPEKEHRTYLFLPRQGMGVAAQLSMRRSFLPWLKP
jgi:hypothetical protein